MTLALAQSPHLVAHHCECERQCKKSLNEKWSSVLQCACIDDFSCISCLRFETFCFAYNLSKALVKCCYCDLVEIIKRHWYAGIFFFFVTKQRLHFFGNVYAAWPINVAILPILLLLKGTNICSKKK